MNLRPLATGRARIADALGEGFTAPVRSLVGELERAGSTALNIIRSEPNAASGNPSDYSETPTEPAGQNNGGPAIVMIPSPTRTRAPATDPEATLEPAIEQPTLDASLTPSLSHTLTPTTIYIASLTPTLHLSQTSIIAPTATQSSTPTETEKPAATPTQFLSNTPAPTSPPPTSAPVSDGYYFVALIGNDGNSGSESQPFRTINRGVSVLGPGDTLYVKSGTYAESLYDVIPSGTSWANPVTLKAYPGDVVTIKPNSGQKVIRFAGSQYIIVDGFILDGANVDEEVVRITSGAHHIRIQNSEIKGAPNQGILIVNYGPIDSDFNEFINLDVHDNGTTDLDHGLYIETSNNLIDRSSIHHNAGWGVHIYSVSNSEVNNNIVSNNVIYDNARVGDRGSGILLSSGSGNLAYNNLVWGNKYGISIAFNGVSDSEVYNNVVYANNGYGISIDVDSADAIIRNNIVYGNAWGEISDAGSGTVQDHNLVGTDPQFANASAHDFRLRTSSPAIDTGIALSAVPYDRDGVSRPHGAGFDIGAYESPSN